MRKFGVVVLFCLIFGALVGGGLVYTGKDKDVAGAISLVKLSPSDKTNIEQTAVMTIPTNASAGTQAKATVKQYDGKQASGTVVYGSSSPDANFVAAKESDGSWKITKTDVVQKDGKIVKTSKLVDL